MENRISEVIDRIREIGGEKIGFIALYGSAVKGKMTGLSDIDIAVFF
jgi:predicted nucleotidyltransferase